MSCEIIKSIKEEIERDKNNLDFRCAFTDKPKCNEAGGCSSNVLIIRDCGPCTIKSYAISSYRPDGWTHIPGGRDKWLDQESKGYRVLKWAYLPNL